MDAHVVLLPLHLWRKEGMMGYNPKKDPYHNGMYILITLIILGIAVMMVVAKAAVGH